MGLGAVPVIVGVDAVVLLGLSRDFRDVAAVVLFGLVRVRLDGEREEAVESSGEVALEAA